jgi:hypothetical protein
MPLFYLMFGHLSTGFIHQVLSVSIDYIIYHCTIYTIRAYLNALLYHKMPGLIPHCPLHLYTVCPYLFRPSCPLTVLFLRIIPAFPNFSLYIVTIICTFYSSLKPSILNQCSLLDPINILLY